MTLNTCHPLHLIFLNDHSIIMSSSSSSSLHRAASHQLAELRERERERETMEKRDKGSSPMAMMGSGDENEDVKTTMRTAETLLRLVPMALCVSALVVMLKNSQTNDFGSLSYSDLGAFRYLVNANGICAGYSLLSAVIVAMPRPSTMPRAWTFFLLDQVLTYVILAAGTVSTEVLYLASKGDTTITWSEACVSFGGFCHRALISTVITFAVVICYAVLSLLSSYNLFSKYDSPVLTYPGKGIETATFHG